MKKTFIGLTFALVLVILGTTSLRAQPAFAWARQFAGSASDHGHTVHADAFGNVFVTGYFSSTADLDPGPGILNFSTVGGMNIFVCKLDPWGTLIWAKTIGNSNTSDMGYSALDGSGNIYTTGRFLGTVDFDPGPGVYNLTSSGISDVFVCKWDGGGNFVWARQMGGSANGTALAVELDGSGNVYCAGEMSGSGDFDPGPGVYSLASSGMDDVFVTKLDPLGNLIWARSFGGTGNDFLDAIAVDGAGNVYTTGSFTQTADFDPGPGILSQTSAGGMDIFIHKMDAAGNLVWAHRAGSTLRDNGHDIMVDPAGNVYTTGEFELTVDFDPSATTNTLTAVFIRDAFVTKWDASGNFVWAKTVGGNYGEVGNTLAWEGSSGQVLFCGEYTGTLDCDPGSGVFTVTSTPPSGHVFIIALDPSGNFVWANTFGGTGSSHVRQVTANGLGNVYLTGDFGDSVDFNPVPGETSYLQGVGGDNAYAIKLSSCGVEDSTITAVVCDGFTGPDNQYYTSTGTYNIVISSTEGCDSVITLELTVNPSAAVHLSPIACNSYTAPDGQVYTSSGTYTANLLTAAGCDSVITLHLNIGHPSSDTVFPVVCDSYTAPDGQVYISTGTHTAIIPNAWGCDSTITMVLTVLGQTDTTLVESHCGSYTAPDGQVYGVSGTYVAIIPNHLGCDSVITIQLTLNSLNASITVNGPTLTANPSGAQYQWVQCDLGYQPLPGVTTQNFTPQANGSYAVIVTIGACVDTTACENVTVVGVQDLKGAHVHIQPNPSQGQVTITCDQLQDVQIFNATGALVRQLRLTEPVTHVNLSSLANGMYHLVFTDGERLVTRKLVVER